MTANVSNIKRREFVLTAELYQNYPSPSPFVHLYFLPKANSTYQSALFHTKFRLGLGILPHSTDLIVGMQEETWALCLAMHWNMQFNTAVCMQCFHLLPFFLQCILEKTFQAEANWKVTASITNNSISLYICLGSYSLEAGSKVGSSMHVVHWGSASRRKGRAGKRKIYWSRRGLLRRWEP